MSGGAASIAEFVRHTRQDDGKADLFELENTRVLEVNLDGLVWSREDAMIAYLGDVTFTRESLAERGLKRLLKGMFTSEGMTLIKAEGRGRVYFAHNGRKIALLHLRGDEIFVNGGDLLAFEDSLEWDITMMRKLSSMLSGGLFQVSLRGTGRVAVALDSTPLTLEVEPGRTVRTDPEATVMWSSGVEPSLRTDLSAKSFVGRGSGEEFQLEFSGDGFVTVQSYQRPLGAGGA